MNYAQNRSNDAVSSVEDEVHHAGDILRKRVERARDIVENVRERAEVAFRDRPYLVPVAAGAVGLGVGVLLGSKISRFIVFTAVGTLISEALGPQIRRVSRELVGQVRRELDQGANEEEGDIDGNG